MKDLQAHLAQLRSDAAECLLLGALATDKKSEMFTKIAEHLNGLASEIEKTIAANRASAIPVGFQPEATVSHSAAADNGDAVATDAAATEHHGNETKRSRRIFAWLLIVVIIAGALLWANWYVGWAEKQVKLFLPHPVEQSKKEPPAEPDDAKTDAHAKCLQQFRYCLRGT